MSFYFDNFESRTPPAPIPHSAVREQLWQFLAVICLCLGGWYIAWRWTDSLNPHALWFSIPLAAAETCAYLGLILFTINLWATRDKAVAAPPERINECLAEPLTDDRPISICVFITTYNEDPELVRLSIRDAMQLRYPHEVRCTVYVLDDGRRQAMRAIADEEGAKYLSRENNVGFKAGNLRNAIEHTNGDFIVICDADTRLFPTYLEHILGYFRDPRMAWVQSPQWFYDLPLGRTLSEVAKAGLGRAGQIVGQAIERVVGEIRFGRDPFVNDPQMFYDVILRRRNWANAAFCCGAASIHRREAIMEAALRSFAEVVSRSADATLGAWSKFSAERPMSGSLHASIRTQAAIAHEFTPYKFHVSEDIYTSLALHADRERGWKSYFHPFVESKMLSPQDLLAWTIQRFKYAGGSLDIFIHDSPLLRRGLTIPQRLMYATTYWSYLGGVWNILFLLAPIIYLTTGIAPVQSYSVDFAAHILPFLLMTELAFMVGTWGIPGYRSKTSYLSFFSVNLRALWTVLAGRKIGFPVTPKELQSERHIKLVIPQLAIIGATVAAAAYGIVSWQGGSSHYTAAGLLSNIFWGGFNILALSGIVLAAFRKHDVAEQADSVVTPRVIPTRRGWANLPLLLRPTRAARTLGQVVGGNSAISWGKI